MSHEFADERRVSFGDDDSECAGATFVPRCPKCFRFVKARDTITFKGSQPHGPNADCKKCGPVEMWFEGYY